jgi:hypothetical protein
VKSFASWKPEQSSIDIDVQKALIALEWARRKETIVFAGPSGTGKTLASAGVDRLLHHAHLILTSGESFRLIEAKNGGGVTPLIPDRQ